MNYTENKSESIQQQDLLPFLDIPAAKHRRKRQLLQAFLLRGVIVQAF
ncbi:unnamed protein product [Schistosoma mattheei]|uniref:Uncharacterized protein n=1 Tax=Schistosoma mattheei TaxID=31246 RepID=A0A183Q1T0_9TREM|nr:unnamed protein product [Schistosoma mattheei]